MRISGSYIDRLFIGILPLMIIAVLLVRIFMSFMATRGNNLVLVGILLTFIFWLFDSLVILRRKTKSLVLNNGIYFGGELIDPKSILKIVPFNCGTTRWEIEMIEFTIADGRVIYVLDKPYSFFKPFMKSTPSKTVRLLVNAYPGLKAKVRKTTTLL